MTREWTLEQWRAILARREARMRRYDEIDKNAETALTFHARQKTPAVIREREQEMIDEAKRQIARLESEEQEP